MTSLGTSIECVLFDLDGTLIDTAADFQRVLDIMREQSGLERLPEQRIYQTVSDGARGLIKLAFDLNEGEEGFAERHQQLLDLYYEQLKQTEARPYPGIMELLQNLEAAEILWGIVTNKPEKYSQLLLEQLDLFSRCPVLVCPDHVGARKPDPESLLLACEKLDCSTERTVYIGDHIRDMQAAKNADIIAVAASYGYLGENARIDEWNADFVINSPSETENLLSILKFA